MPLVRLAPCPPAAPHVPSLLPWLQGDAIGAQELFKKALEVQQQQQQQLGDAASDALAAAADEEEDSWEGELRCWPACVVAPPACMACH